MQPTPPPPAASSPPLALEDAAAYPLPGLVHPQSISFTPDDRALSYLRSPERNLTRQLYRLDLESGDETLLVAPPGGGATEENLSLTEKLRRERQRVRELGVTSYAWATQGTRLLVPLTGDIYVQDGERGPPRHIVDTDDKPAIDPQLSRDGMQVAYVQDDELYVVSAQGGAPSQRTKGARGTGKTHGLAEYIAQEEMNRSHGFWWSWDGEQLAFTEVDETHIPKYRIVHQGKDRTGEGAQEDHAYPFAGAANAKVRLGVVAASGSDKVTWMDLGDDPDPYLARVQWLPDGSLTAQIENRAQTHLTLLRLDPKTGRSTPLLTESSDLWINLHDMLRPIAEGPFAGHFVWASERSGYRHLYLYDGTGQLVRALTSGGGEAQVDAIVEIDEPRGLLYYLGNTLGEGGDPTGQRLYVVPLAGGEPRCLTPEPGSHGVVIDHALRRFVDVHSSIAIPPRLRLRDLNTGAVLKDIPTPEDPRVAELKLPPPELATFKNRHGDTLHAAIYRPPSETFGEGPFPTMVSVYGGPHAQRVVDAWGTTVDMRAQALRSRGYLVVKIDNRGSARRGLAFEAAIRHDLGHLELEDQQDGVDWLVKRGLTDRQRVGIYGWSYGGYLAAMALVRAPETFKLAIAGAPVTHWDGYDTHYTERYMGTPAENQGGYTVSSVMHHVDNLRGKLLLVHGMIDENVHFRHTARLINALITARKPYDLLLFPDERHMPRRLEDRVHMEQQILDYIGKHL
ncbi:MAG: DPP IV N-terminal domain-containing protein [Nannocystis sp.]|uniref:S9 family peptidase n=1 Tax=Nannocystis sp. TaxID=1962667 RepID=UPI002425BE43|nr:DPP IV N-terminal domain-containing protein [Nannocystis sp.]MBK9757746.1 DPP IV N-terminal domain-containing protein [Nannocystis sp.]